MKISDLIDYAKDVISIAPVSEQLLRPDSKAVCFRTQEVKPYVRMYMDGTKEGQFILSIIVASDLSDECVDQLNKYQELFTIDDEIALTDLIDITSKPSTGAVFQGIAENNRLVFEMSVTVEYMEKRGN